MAPVFVNGEWIVRNDPGNFVCKMKNCPNKKPNGRCGLSIIHFQEAQGGGWKCIDVADHPNPCESCDGQLVGSDGKRYTCDDCPAIREPKKAKHEKRPVRIFFRKAELLLAGKGPDGSDDILREQLKKSGITEGLILVKMYLDPDEELCPDCKGSGFTGGDIADFLGGDPKDDKVHTYSECQTCEGRKVVPKSKETPEPKDTTRCRWVEWEDNMWRCKCQDCGNDSSEYCTGDYPLADKKDYCPDYDGVDSPLEEGVVDG